VAKVKRTKPKRLGEKLRAIRVGLEYSQDDMLKALDMADASYRSAISGYELGTREPSLIVLLKYARLAGISTDVLIDDSANL
jgi:transcriptional regulator with XRE-family HTH domain